MHYRDYFSLKTLARFGVSPDREIITEGKAEDIRRTILSAFGTLSPEDRIFLARKTDAALCDMRLTEPAPSREQIDICEAAEPLPLTSVPLTREPDVPQTGKELI